MNIELKRLLLEIVIFFAINWSLSLFFHIRLTIPAQTLMIIIIVNFVRKIK